MLWQFGTPLVWENHPHSKPNLVVPIVFDLEVLSDQKEIYFCYGLWMYKNGPPNYYKWIYLNYTHLQPWLNRVCWGYNYLIIRGAPSCNTKERKQRTTEKKTIPMPERALFFDLKISISARGRIFQHIYSRTESIFFVGGSAASSI